LVLARKEDRKEFLNQFPVIKTSIFGGEISILSKNADDRGKETRKKQEKEYSRRHVWKEQLYIIIGASSSSRER